MKGPARYPSSRALVGYAGIALATVALAGCNGAAAPAAAAARTTAASADGASGKAGDPAANDNAFHESAVAHGLITARKACDLLTRSDAEAAVGQPLPKNDANMTLGTCQYTAEDFAAGASLTVGSWESIKDAATGGTHQPETITGVGDEALYFAGSEKGGSPLYVRKGGDGFLLVLNGPKIDHMASVDAVVVEKALALKISGKF